MLITITHNGFHGRRTLRFHGTMPEGRGPWDIAVSLRVARRLNSECCGISACRCGEDVAEIQFGEDGKTADCWVVVPANMVVRGNYPQG